MDVRSTNLTDLAKGLLRAILADVANVGIRQAVIVERADDHLASYREKVARMQAQGTDVSGENESLHTAHSLGLEILEASRPAGDFDRAAA